MEKLFSALPRVIKKLVRDFVFRKAVVLWCESGKVVSNGEIHFVPPMFTANKEQQSTKFHSIALRLVAGDRVWIHQARRGRKSSCILNHRRDAEADTEHKTLEANEQTKLVQKHRGPYYGTDASTSSDIDDHFV